MELCVVKILLLIAAVWVVILLVRRYQRSLAQPDATVKPVENMVKCAHCAVNLPRGEAIYTQGDFYCTVEHQRLGKK